MDRHLEVTQVWYCHYLCNNLLHLKDAAAGNKHYRHYLFSQLPPGVFAQSHDPQSPEQLQSIQSHERHVNHDKLELTICCRQNAPQFKTWEKDCKIIFIKAHFHGI